MPSKSIILPTIILLSSQRFFSHQALDNSPCLLHSRFSLDTLCSSDPDYECFGHLRRCQRSLIETETIYTTRLSKISIQIPGLRILARNMSWMHPVDLTVKSPTVRLLWGPHLKHLDAAIPLVIACYQPLAPLGISGSTVAI